MREKEYKLFVDKHKELLKREQEAKEILSNAKLQLKTVKEDIKNNNKWLMKQ